MSVGRKKKDPLDRYDTDRESIQKLFRHWRPRIYAADFVWEPAAGANHIGDVLAERFPLVRLHTSDIEPRHEKVMPLDFLNVQPGDMSPADFIITNPPFRLADQFLRQAMRLVSPDGYVALLLRAAFIEAKRRENLHAEFPIWRAYFLRSRPHFTGPNSIKKRGGDASMYAWFIWSPSKRPRHFASWII